MQQSEDAIPLKEQIVHCSLSEVKSTSANVEFIILPYYRTLEAIAKKDKLYAALNSFISSTNNDSTIAILSSPIFAADYCTQLHHDVYLKLWIAVKLENPIEHKDYLKEQHAALLILTRYK